MRTALLALLFPIALTAGTLRIEGSIGDLNIESWDQPTIDIQPEQAAIGVEMTKQVAGDDTTLTFKHKHWISWRVAYRIRVPRNTNLVIHHDEGAVTIYDVAGDIDATTRYGDVTMLLPARVHYELDAKRKIGGFYADPGALSDGTTHHLRVRVAIGGITIQRLDSPALVN